MNYYLAVDNKVSAKKQWVYFKFRGSAPRKPFFNNNLSNHNPNTKPTGWKIPDYFGLFSSEYNNKELDIRTVRNACIMYMKKNDEAYCINILKRIKKDIYELVERIYRDGISEVDEDKRGWDFIQDIDFNEDNTFDLF